MIKYKRGHAMIGNYDYTQDCLDWEKKHGKIPYLGNRKKMLPNSIKAKRKR